MEGHASPMVSSGAFSGPEHQLEGSNSNSSGISSSRGHHGDGAQGTARAPTERKARLRNWTDEETEELLVACYKLKEEKGRRRMRAPPKWQSISGRVKGKTADECEGRMETLMKSFYKIKKYCDDHHKQFDQLSKEEFKSLKLASKMKSNWYYQTCKIKEKPQNTLRVSSPDSGDRSILSCPAPAAVMAGPQSDIIGEVVGTPEAAWAARVRPRRASPAHLQSCCAAPELPPLADSACHPHQHVSRVEPWIATVADAAEPPHIPPVDLEYLQVFEGLDDLGYLSPLRT